MKKGTLCVVAQTVGGGRPLVTVEKGTPVMIIKRYSEWLVRVYCPKHDAQLTVSERQLTIAKKQ